MNARIKKYILIGVSIFVGLVLLLTVYQYGLQYKTYDSDLAVYLFNVTTYTEDDLDARETKSVILYGSEPYVLDQDADISFYVSGIMSDKIVVRTNRKVLLNDKLSDKAYFGWTYQRAGRIMHEYETDKYRYWDITFEDIELKEDEE